jgi:L-cystine uptake protein TcyP (sodium:dicarboxylate symporter family)
MHTINSSSTTYTESESPVLRLRLDAFMYILVLQCLVMTLPVCKLVGVGPMAHWSWLWVLAPVWGPGALLAVIIGVEGIIDAVQAKQYSEQELTASHLSLHQMSVAQISVTVAGQQS